MTASNTTIDPEIVAKAANASRALDRETAVSLALHPFRGERARQVEAPEGLTLEALVDAHVTDPVLRRHIVVLRDGILIPRDQWALERVKAGQHILVQVRPSGGDDDNKFIRTILQIAIIVIAAWVGAPGGPLAAWSAGARAAASASVAVLGNLAVNAIVPPPQFTVDPIEAPSPTYTIEGARNQLRRYQPMPVVFGEHRFFPPLQGAPVQELRGDDVYLRYLLNLGPMPIEVDASSIKIGETDISSFAGVEYEIVTQTSDAPITLYTDDPFTESVGSVLDHAGWLSRTTQTDTTEIIAVIAFPQGLGQVNDQGQKRSLSATFEMRYRPVGQGGAWTTVRPTAPEANTGATGAGYTRYDYFGSEPTLAPWEGNLPAGVPSGSHSVTRSDPGKVFSIALRAAVPEGQYDVEIRRTDTPAGDSQRKFDRSEWSALRSISSRDPMPLKTYAYMALSIKATDQLSGVVDTINMEIKRKAPRLSTTIANDPNADLSAVTASDWTTEAVTRNVADNLLFLYRGAHTTKPLADDEVNWPSIAAFYKWCAANNYYCDFVLEQNMTRDQAAQLLCATARARPIRLDGKLSVVIDGVRAEGERQLFTPLSTRGFRVRKTFPGEVHALRIPFVNRDDNYQLDEMLVFADDYSEDGAGQTTAATLYEKFELPGVTDPDQIWRNGRYFMYTALLQTQRYDFDVDVESVVSRSGDLAAVAHDVMLVGLGSGRVKSRTVDGGGNVTSITLDEEGDEIEGRLWMVAGKSYAIRWRFVEETETGSGTYQASVSSTQAVTTVAGSAQTLTFPTALAPASAPAVGDVVAFGESGKEIAQILIDTIEGAEDLGARIEAVDYAPTRHSADSGTVPAHTSKVTLPRRPLPPQPTHEGTSVTEEGIFVRFDVPKAYETNLTGFRVRWRQTPEVGSSARFERLPDLQRDERVVVLPAGVPGQTYDVEITTLGKNDLASDPLIVTSISASDAVEQPAGLTVTPATFTGPGGAKVPGVTLAWTAIQDPRVRWLEVYVKPQGAAASQYVQHGVLAANASEGELRGFTPGQVLDFGFRLVNERGAESEPIVEVLNKTIPDTLVGTDALAPTAELDAIKSAVEAEFEETYAGATEALTAVAKASETGNVDSLLNWIEDPRSEPGWGAGEGVLTTTQAGVAVNWNFTVAGVQTSKVLWFPHRKPVKPGVKVQASVDVAVFDQTASVDLQAVFFNAAGTQIAATSLQSGSSGTLSDVVAAPDNADTVQFRLVPTATASGVGRLKISNPLSAYALPDQTAANAYQAPESEIMARVKSVERTIGGVATKQAGVVSETRRARALAAATFATIAGLNSAVAQVEIDINASVAATYLTQADAATTYRTAAQVDQAITDYNTTLQAQLTSDYLTIASASVTYRTAAQVDQAIADYQFTIGTTTDTITAHVTANAGAITSINSSAAFYELEVAAGGGNPAVYSMTAGDGGSTIALAADALYLLNTAGGGSTIKALEVTGGNVRVVNDLQVDNALVMSSTGVIRGGQTDYDTGVGFFLGYAGGAYKISIGNPAGQALTWDGTTLSIDGTLAANSVGASQINVTNLQAVATNTGSLTVDETLTIGAAGKVELSFGTSGKVRMGSLTSPRKGFEILKADGSEAFYADDLGALRLSGDAIPFTRGSTAPSTPNTGDFWYDDGNEIFYRRGPSAWEDIGNGFNNTNQLTDGAGLGNSAIWANVTGAGRPADNATVGASWTGNVTNRPTELTDGRVSAGLAANGDVARSIPSAIRVSSDLMTRGGGGGNYVGDLDATAGANWSSNVTNIPTELSDGRVSAGLAANGDVARSIPSAIRVSSDLMTRGGGGGNYVGDLDATAGANWSSNVTNIPTALSDGRVGAGLAANGDVARAIPAAIRTSSDILSRMGGGTYTGDLAATAGADYATNVSNKPTNLSGINASEGAKLSGIEPNATNNTGALADKDTIGDADLVALRALIVEGAGAPTPTSARLYRDTTNHVAYLDDGTTIIRLSKQLKTDALGSNATYDGGYKVVCGVEVANVQDIDELVVHTVIAGMQGPNAANGTGAEANWNVYISDTELTEGTVITDATTYAAFGNAASNMTFQQTGPFIEVVSNTVSNLAGSSRFVGSYEGTCYVYLCVEVTGSGPPEIYVATTSEISVLIR